MSRDIAVLSNWMICLVQYANLVHLSNPSIIVESPKEDDSPVINDLVSPRRDYIGGLSDSPKKIARDIAAQLTARIAEE
jgi:hypothetical protein